MKKLLLLVLFIMITMTLSGCDFGTTPDDEDVELIITAGQDTVEINTEWVDSGAKFFIDDKSLTVVGIGTVDTNTLGVYEIEYAHNYEGEIYLEYRYVIVVDQIAPVITLIIGVDTITVDNTWQDSGATVVDNSNEELDITVSGTVDITTVGQYEITYTAEDSSGNITVKVRYVNVVE